MFDWDEGNIDKNLGHGVQESARTRNRTLSGRDP